MKPRKWAAAVVGVVVIAGVVTGCASADSADDEESSIVIRVSSLPNQDNWNPLLGGGTFGSTEGQAVYDTLIRVRGAEIEPRLAEDFEVSEDGLRFDVKLREGVEFTDGTPLNAEGVATYISALVPSEDGLATILRDYGTEVTVTGEYELTFTTTKPLHDLWMRALDGVPILPPQAAEDPEAYREAPVGTGPYLLDEVSVGLSMSFVRNPDYWNPDAFDFDRLTVVMIEDDIAALNALKSGQIDATVLDSTNLAVEAEAAGFALSRGSGVGNFATLFFRDRTGEVVPALGDVRVRQAINLALDRDTIAASLYGGFARISSQPFSLQSLHYVEGGDDTYTYDLERAKELLADAGYADGFDLTIVTAPDFATTQPIVAQTLEELGIRVTWDTRIDLGGIWAETEGTAVELLEVSLECGTDCISYTWGFSSAESTELFRIFLEAAPAESRAAGKELGRYILDNAWYAPVALPDRIVASIPEVTVDVYRYFALLESYSSK